DMTDRNKTIRKFQKAADQRFTTAEFLLENEYHRDAMYLGGYVVECSLKALILKWSPVTEFEETLSLLTEVGAKGHDFEYLKAQLKRRKFGFPLTGPAEGMPPDSALFPADVRRSLTRVSTWDTSQRYEVSLVRFKEADEFVTAVKTVRDWTR